MFATKRVCTMLHSLPNPLQRAKVVKRPSASIRSPYVADIQLDDGSHALCHTPGLGCSGLVEKDSVIYVNASKPGSKTDFTAQIAECRDAQGPVFIGVHSLISQIAAKGLLSRISETATWSQEVRIDESTRIDYVGTMPNNKKLYVEIKTAIVSHEMTLPRDKRRAIFPDGYRKKVTDTISPRAVKHAECLTDLMSKADTEACVLLFIVSRNDCETLLINPKDPIYCDALKKAKDAGVQLRAMSLSYSLDGRIVFDKECVVELGPLV